MIQKSTRSTSSVTAIIMIHIIMPKLIIERQVIITAIMNLITTVNPMDTVNMESKN